MGKDMKPHLCLSTALAASALVFGVFASDANAISISSVTQDLLTVPTTTNVPGTPDFGVSAYDFNVVQDTANQWRSPWEANNDAHLTPMWTDNHYSSVRGGNAGFNVTGDSASLFWGSPDLYNSITFWTGINGTGSSVTLTGTALAYGFYGHGHDLVTITLDTIFHSVVLSSDQAAFEFTNASASCRECAPAPTPLPGALPLLVSGIAGMGGLLGWRKRRKAAVKALAA